MATKVEDGDKTIFTFGDATIELASVRNVCDGPSSLSTSVWAASILLCRHLTKIKEELLGKQVLELGCGQALPSLLVATLAPSANVILTDCSSKGLRLLRERCMRNSAWEKGWTSWESACGHLQIRRHVWETDMVDEEGAETLCSREVRHWSNGDDDGALSSAHDSVPSLEPGRKFDLILASDVTYFSSQIDPLVGTIRRRLAPGGVALVVVTVRACRTALLRQLCEALLRTGLTYDEAELAMEDESEPSPASKPPRTDSPPDLPLPAAAADPAAEAPLADQSPRGPCDDAPSPRSPPRVAAAPQASGCSGRAAAERGLEAWDHVLVEVDADGEEAYSIDFDAGRAADVAAAAPALEGGAGHGGGTDGSVHYTRTEIGWTFLRVKHAASPPEHLPTAHGGSDSAAGPGRPAAATASFEP